MEAGAEALLVEQAEEEERGAHEASSRTFRVLSFRFDRSDGQSKQQQRRAAGWTRNRVDGVLLAILLVVIVMWCEVRQSPEPGTHSFTPAMRRCATTIPTTHQELMVLFGGEERAASAGERGFAPCSDIVDLCLRGPFSFGLLCGVPLRALTGRRASWRSKATDVALSSVVFVAGFVLMIVVVGHLHIGLAV